MAEAQSRPQTTGTLRLWDLETGQILRILQGHTNVIEAVAVTPSGRWALCGLYDGTVWVWDLDLVGAEHPPRVLKIHLGRVHAIAVTPDGRCALSGGEDRTLRLWDLKSGETLNILKGHTDSVSAVAISADGRQAFRLRGTGRCGYGI